MSLKGFCLQPMYETQVSYPAAGNVTPEDRWITKNNNSDVLYGSLLLYRSSVHANVDAARGSFIGYIPGGDLITHTAGGTAFVYNCVEE